MPKSLRIAAMIRAKKKMPEDKDWNPERLAHV